MKSLLVCAVVVCGAPAVLQAAPPLITIETGPVKGAAASTRSMTLQGDVIRRAVVYDVQDGREHRVGGLPLAELLAHVKPPKAVDAVVFVYEDGMRIPVQLKDKAKVDAIFVAFEHGDVLDRFGTTYPLHKKGDLECPKVVFTPQVTTYSIWHYPGQLVAVKLVTWKNYEAQLAQPTRRVPDKSGWSLYLQHCGSCHGIGGQGATRGPDFLTNMDAYRRVPPLAETKEGELPSLHEKVAGFVDGTMPVLNHIPRADTVKLWNWLHRIHSSGTK